MPEYGSAARLFVVACALAALGLAAPARVQSAPARAQTAPAQPIVKPGPCDGPEFRQFDFWIGDWDVFTPDGQLAGTNKVERILGGCVIAENWSGSKGTEGKSFNVFSTADKQWHQTWVDSQGTRLELAGTLGDNGMVLEGDSPVANGNGLKNRITWQKLPDGRVRQHWQVSADGGEKWTDAFIGLYTAKRNEAATKGMKR